MKPKRLLVLAAVGLLLIFASVCYVYFWQSVPIGSGPAGPEVPAASFSRHWTEKPVLMVGLGDSVTAGFGARRGYSYFDRLVVNPPDEFQALRNVSLQAVLPNLKFTNLAISGTTSGEHFEQQLRRIPAGGSNSVGIIVMTTGGNDIIHNYGRTAPRELAMYGATWKEAQPWITNFEQRLDLMIDRINANFPNGCHIFLANIFDPTDGVGDAKRAGLPNWDDGMKILDAYNDVIRRSAQKHPFVHSVDIHGAFLGHGIHCTQIWSTHYDARDPHYWYYSNLEDPNERGYDVIRRLFLVEMSKVNTY
jgi:lysophospholipase L1-like esterase